MALILIYIDIDLATLSLHVTISKNQLDTKIDGMNSVLDLVLVRNIYTAEISCDS